MEQLTPHSLVATVFFFVWLAVYPIELKEALFFQAGRKIEDIVVGILSWVFLAEAVYFIIMWIVAL